MSESKIIERHRATLEKLSERAKALTESLRKDLEAPKPEISFDSLRDLELLELAGDDLEWTILELRRLRGVA